MSVVATFTVSGLQFPLTRALSHADGGRIEVDRLVDRDDAVSPLFWVVGDEEVCERTESALRVEDRVDAVEVVDDLDDRRLYRLDWQSRDGGLLDSLADADCTVLSAQGTADACEFVVRFASPAELQRFLDDCEHQNVPLADVGHYEPEDLREEGVTGDDVDLLTFASDAGYFDGRASLDDLAEEYGTTPTDLRERLDAARRRLSDSLFD